MLALLLLIFAQAHLLLATTPQEATAFVLLYGYPLRAWEQLTGALKSTSTSVNTFGHERELQGASSNYVVKPNVDTMYSVMIFDLSHQDVVISIPEISSEQFALFSFYDPYGNNFAQIGPEQEGLAGDYRLSRRGEGHGHYDGGYNRHEQRSEHYTTRCSNGSDFKGTITSPTTYGSVFIRWLANGTNLDAIHTYQDGVKTQNVTRSKNHAETASPSLASILADNYPTEPVSRILSQLARYAAIDGPEIVSDTASVNGNLTMAGISNGTYTPVLSVNLTLANQTALAQASSDYTSALVDLGNGWNMLALNSTGDFGTQYGVRTAVAASVYVMVKGPTAIYPDWSNGTSDNVLSGANSLTLGPDDAYIYTFSRKPPLEKLGFWSVTAYHNGYLIPNGRDVYSLGDRSNLTFPNGTLVYGDGEKDGVFEILIQPADVVPPANWTNNWLPAPSGGGSMNAALRFYEGEQEIWNGGWEFPGVRRVGAIRG